MTSSPNHACWTCHLRKKKCAGGIPDCHTCCTLQIPCYGYGPKPLWMDGGAVEKEKVADIRRQVKITTDGLRRARALESLKKKEESRIESRGLERKKNGERRTQVNASVLSRTVEVVAFPPTPTGDAEGALNASAEKQSWVPDRDLEALLLMHYFDHVFPLQFPFYNPPIAEGGRGWILGLLQHSKPVRDAALSLAAYHRQSSLPNGDSIVQQYLYSLALKGLRERIEVLSRMTAGLDGLKDSIEVFACVIQMIFLEVSQGGTDNWLKHLEVAPDIIQFLQIYCLADEGGPELVSSSAKLPSLRSFAAHPPSSHKDLSFVDHAAMLFFGGIIIWFDTISAASTRTAPKYSSICATAVGTRTSRLQLPEIMGCENWCMTNMRDIAVLDVWKVESLAAKTFNVSELRSKAKNLETRIAYGILVCVQELRMKQNGEVVGNESDNELIPSVEVLNVTHAFACASLVYLHVTALGPNPYLPEIKEAVRKTLEALEVLPVTLLTNAVWPLCIGACMAGREDESAWGSLIERVRLKNIFGSAPAAWTVVETCWGMRREGAENCDWESAMKRMGYRVLLV